MSAFLIIVYVKFAVILMVNHGIQVKIDEGKCLLFLNMYKLKKTGAFKRLSIHSPFDCIRIFNRLEWILFINMVIEHNSI